MTTLKSLMKREYTNFHVRTTPSASREQEVSMVSSAVAAYLESGGTITTLPSYEAKPLPFRRNSLKEPVFTTLAELEAHRAQAAKKAELRREKAEIQALIERQKLKDSFSHLSASTVESILLHARDKWDLRDISAIVKQRQGVIKAVCAYYNQRLVLSAAVAKSGVTRRTKKAC